MKTLEWQAEDLVAEREPVGRPTPPAQPGAVPEPEPETVEEYVPRDSGAPRPARLIAMQARREQERRLAGW